MKCWCLLVLAAKSTLHVATFWSLVAWLFVLGIKSHCSHFLIGDRSSLLLSCYRSCSSSSSQIRRRACARILTISRHRLLLPCRWAIPIPIRRSMLSLHILHLFLEWEDSRLAASSAFISWGFSTLRKLICCFRNFLPCILVLICGAYRNCLSWRRCIKFIQVFWRWNT